MSKARIASPKRNDTMVNLRVFSLIGMRCVNTDADGTMPFQPVAHWISSSMDNQQNFLRSAAETLGLTQKALAARMGAPWPTFEKWLLPSDRANAREMPGIAWTLVREILAHEKLKAVHPGKHPV